MATMRIDTISSLFASHHSYTTHTCSGLEYSYHLQNSGLGKREREREREERKELVCTSYLIQMAVVSVVGSVGKL